jgi:squalene-hopene/tetraprenyl-beta-curcumene cyclase
VNVFTRIALALFRQIPWRATPVSRVELLLLPRWFPWNIYRMSYWTRTVMVPLLVLTTLRPAARNPRGVNIDELFLTPPNESQYRLANPTGHLLGSLFIAFDRLIFPFQRFIPKFATRRAVDRAMSWITQRLNGDDGLGGIFPAMANALLAYDALGYSKDDPAVRRTRKAIDDLVIDRGDMAYCQPCVSPVWDTALAAQALMEVDQGESNDGMVEAANWLADRQVLDVRGDWIEARPETRPGGWAFQYWNDYYPDVDDTAAVVMALHRADPKKFSNAIERGAEWVLGMQSKNGGWAAFDADNDYELLENIPFADHGALLDPPTADVTARSISMLAQLGYNASHPDVARGLEFLRSQQEEDGSWFGRWGTNYIYGIWSVLLALNAIGEDMDAPYVRRAVAWLESRQRRDGGWGEDCATYWMEHRTVSKVSTPSQTAWAVLALLAAGEVESDTVGHGIRYLMESRNAEGAWDEEFYNAVGFPRVFYLLYHGYREYFPLWALARYRNLKSSNSLRPSFGM